MSQPVKLPKSARLYLPVLRSIVLRHQGEELKRVSQEIVESLSTLDQSEDGIRLRVRAVHQEDPLKVSQQLLAECSVQPSPAKFDFVRQLQHSIVIETGTVIAVDLDVAIDVSAMEATVPREWDVASVARSIVQEVFLEMISRLLLAACIAHPDGFRTLSAMCNVDGLTTVSDAVAFDLEVEFDVEAHAWPRPTLLSLRQAYEWLLRLPRYRDGVGKGRLGRAVAALSYIASPTHQLESEVLWPLIGLEALYCTGKDGLQAQILRKSEVYLGARHEDKKRLNRVYEARSKFVHGQYDLPMAYTAYNATPEYEAVNEELDAAHKFATKVLVATLQKAAAEGRFELEFEYAVVS